MSAPQDPEFEDMIRRAQAFRTLLQEVGHIDASGQVMLDRAGWDKVDAWYLHQGHELLAQGISSPHRFLAQAPVRLTQRQKLCQRLIDGCRFLLWCKQLNAT